MADGSAIEWTDATWNPVTGCTKITAGWVLSEGCGMVDGLVIAASDEPEIKSQTV
jgi:protein gp37